LAASARASLRGGVENPLGRGRRHVLELMDRIGITQPGLVRQFQRRPWLGHGHQRYRRLDLLRQRKTMGHRPARKLRSIGRD